MGQMYGAKRVLMKKDGTIVLAGGKGYFPIGRWHKKENGFFYAITLTPAHRWDRTLRDDNTGSITAPTLKLIRGLIETQYRNHGAF